MCNFINFENGRSSTWLISRVTESRGTSLTVGITTNWHPSALTWLFHPSRWSTNRIPKATEWAKGVSSEFKLNARNTSCRWKWDTRRLEKRGDPLGDSWWHVQNFQGVRKCKLIGWNRRIENYFEGFRYRSRTRRARVHSNQVDW